MLLALLISACIKSLDELEVILAEDFIVIGEEPVDSLLGRWLMTRFVCVWTSPRNVTPGDCIVIINANNIGEAVFGYTAAQTQCVFIEGLFHWK